LYPGILSSIVEGLDTILAMPHGCFEQTSSTAYPNLLALDYMKKTGKITPEIDMKARGFVNAGYQRLLTFEVPGGGFSLYGRAPASVWLSAYGLMEFNDMKAVQDIDEGILGRTSRWLAGQRGGDGSYENDPRVTAYVAMALLEVQGKKSPGISQTVDYIKSRCSQVDDPYVCALCANVLALYEPDGQAFAALLSRLEKMKKQEGDAVSWGSSSQTLCHGSGKPAEIETTALMARALIAGRSYPELLQGALTFLVKSKDPRGTWFTTQATIQALRALILSSGATVGKGSGEVTISVNGKQVRELVISQDQADVLQLVDLTHLARVGDNSVDLVFSGNLQSLYQVVGSYYVPWVKAVHVQEPLDITLSYDRTLLRASDTVKATAVIKNTMPSPAPMVMVDLGIPPGFMVNEDDFESKVRQGQIDRYEITARQVIVYLGTVEPRKGVTLRYSLVAKFPIRAQSPASRAYEYYNPDVQGVSEPVKLNVD
jgi:uncharacterized protein YfaS (alpha-2-macroglobulin family)